ncbi:MAG: hypothetical protein H7Y13_14580 [Sphingobacteriaceae bacterium]|nr:hypothetical protein [Sphingobacteriaceae bacterium]
MEYQTTIEINNCIKQITLKPALYMDVPLWEITLDGKNHIIRKNADGWDQSSDSDLNFDLLDKIGDAIDYLRSKDAS